ncbi:MAG: hypothetical protein IJZ79_05420 [Bacilli bacterium]|nr:hypothetical protein [Bacilli bacterium]
MLLCLCQGKLAYNKKGIPSFAELGTIPLNNVLVPTYTVGTTFIKIIKIVVLFYI